MNPTLATCRSSESGRCARPRGFVIQVDAAARQAPRPYGREVAERAGDGHCHFFEGLGHLSLEGHRHNEVNAKLAEVFRRYL